MPPDKSLNVGSTSGSSAQASGASQSGSATIEDQVLAGPSNRQENLSAIEDGSIATLQPVEQQAAATISAEGNSWLSYADLISDSYPAKSKFIYLKAYKLFERYL